MRSCYQYACVYHYPGRVCVSAGHRCFLTQLSVWAQLVHRSRFEKDEQKSPKDHVCDVLLLTAAQQSETCSFPRITIWTKTSTRPVPASHQLILFIALRYRIKTKTLIRCSARFSFWIPLEFAGAYSCLTTRKRESTRESSDCCLVEPAKREKGGKEGAETIRIGFYFSVYYFHK